MDNNGEFALCKRGFLMKIIIVGCGKIGESLIGSLVSEGHDIVAIDNNQAILDGIIDIYDAMGVCGNGATCDTLIEAGVEKTELFIAVTGSDEVNMLACFIAKKMGATHTIARVRAPGYDQNMGYMRQQLDISLVINPELLAAQEFFNVLKHRFTRSYGTDAILLATFESDGKTVFPVRYGIRAEKDVPPVETGDFPVLLDSQELADFIRVAGKEGKTDFLFPSGEIWIVCCRPDPVPVQQN